MIFSIVVAASENNVIGMKGAMPWKKVPADLKFFREKTSGHWCILGRKTYNALNNQALPAREFIVITRDTKFKSDDSVVVHSLHDAMNYPDIQNEEEVIILGGGEIYKQALPFAHRVYLTRIHEKFEGDAFFPELDPEKWEITKNEMHTADEKNPYDYTFLVYERK